MTSSVPSQATSPSQESNMATDTPTQTDTPTPTTETKRDATMAAATNEPRYQDGRSRDDYFSLETYNDLVANAFSVPTPFVDQNSKPLSMMDLLNKEPGDRTADQVMWVFDYFLPPNRVEPTEQQLEVLEAVGESIVALSVLNNAEVQTLNKYSLAMQRMYKVENLPVSVYQDILSISEVSPGDGTFKVGKHPTSQILGTPLQEKNREVNLERSTEVVEAAESGTLVAVEPWEFMLESDGITCRIGSAGHRTAAICDAKTRESGTTFSAIIKVGSHVGFYGTLDHGRAKDAKDMAMAKASLIWPDLEYYCTEQENVVPLASEHMNPVRRKLAGAYSSSMKHLIFRRSAKPISTSSNKYQTTKKQDEFARTYGKYLADLVWLVRQTDTPNFTKKPDTGSLWSGPGTPAKGDKPGNPKTKMAVEHVVDALFLCTDGVQSAEGDAFIRWVLQAIENWHLEGTTMNWFCTKVFKTVSKTQTKLNTILNLFSMINLALTTGCDEPNNAEKFLAHVNMLTETDSANTATWREAKVRKDGNLFVLESMDCRPNSDNDMVILGNFDNSAGKVGFKPSPNSQLSTSWTTQDYPWTPQPTATEELS